jgi:hypothetical protein
MARGQVEIRELVKLVKGVPKRGVVKPAHPYIEKSRPPKPPQKKER